MNKLGALAAVAAVGMQAGVALATTQTPVVNTTYGPIQGFVQAGINTFLGVPYAAPPVGTLRWAPPVAHATWTTTIQTVAFGNFCPQGLSQLSLGGGNEDCLYLNVQAPANATQNSKLPVLFWIHGGGLTTGSGQEYDGSSLINTGKVVFVSINYRLGILGFLAHPALAAEHQVNGVGVSGNYGTLDQQFALQWVRQNITQFGGDPHKIMIYGESAGGQSTITNLVSPLTGPIHAAVIESGSYASTFPTQSAAAAAGSQFGTGVGCTSQTNASCLRAIAAADLVADLALPVGANLPIAPNVDTWVVTQQPFQAIAAGNFPHVPIIDGTNHDEYRLFVSEHDFFNAYNGHPGPYTTQEYIDFVDGIAGSFAPQVLAEYPVSSFPNPGYAVAAVGTDGGFACNALILDALLSKYTATYAYELNDPNAPNVFLPTDPYMPSIGDAHATEMPYLYPTYKNQVLDLGTAQFSPSQLSLASGMQSAWTSLDKYGRPLAPRGGAWPRYVTAQHNFVSLVPPSWQTRTIFAQDHKCSFWGPALLQLAGLPADTQY
jgi:para-nitrobenzyl esterase